MFNAIENINMIHNGDARMIALNLLYNGSTKLVLMYRNLVLIQLTYFVARGRVEPPTFGL